MADIVAIYLADIAPSLVADIVATLTVDTVASLVADIVLVLVADIAPSTTTDIVASLIADIWKRNLSNMTFHFYIFDIDVQFENKKLLNFRVLWLKCRPIPKTTKNVTFTSMKLGTAECRCEK